MDLISYEDNDKTLIEQYKEFYDDKINRLLLFNECISQVQICVYIHLPAMLVRLCCLYLQEI